jgi:glycosyltransferase involved in cell wall biosynthesis
MKNILYIAPDISVKGGISTVIGGLLDSRLSQKYNIILVASHVDGSKIRKLVQAISGLLKTAYYLTFKNIDIVHIHGGDITSVKRKYFFFRLVKLFKRKVIYHFHGAFFMEQYPYASSFWKNHIKSFLDESNMVICLSDSWKKSIMQIASESNVQVIYNSVPLPALNEENKFENKMVNITFLGLIGERKGIFDLIKVMSRLIADGFNIHLNVGGNGDISRLDKEIEMKGLKNHVTYMGWIKGDAKDKLMRNTDIFVLPSYGEGMPMSILEAMSYAIPVVSTLVGGIPELIINGTTGYMIQPGDLNNLYARILHLANDADKRRIFGQRGRKVIEEKYNLSVNVNKIDAIYDLL